MLGEFNGGCTAADGFREQPLLAAILQEANVANEPRAISNHRRVGSIRGLGSPSYQSGCVSLIELVVKRRTSEPSRFIT